MAPCGPRPPPPLPLQAPRGPRPPPTWPQADPAARHGREGEEGGGAGVDPPWPRRELAVSMAGEGGPPSSSEPPPQPSSELSTATNMAPGGSGGPPWPRGRGGRGRRRGPAMAAEGARRRHGRGGRPAAELGASAAAELRAPSAATEEREGAGSSATGEGCCRGGRGPPARGQRSLAPPCRPRRRVRRPWARPRGPNPSVMRPLPCFVLVLCSLRPMDSAIRTGRGGARCCPSNADHARSTFSTEHATSPHAAVAWNGNTRWLFG